MRKISRYFLVAALLVFGVGCGEDEKGFSVTPAIGFASKEVNVLESIGTAVRVRFFSNVKIQDPVTLTIQVNDTEGLDYGIDYTTEPEPVDNIITVTLDPEDDQPSFFVLPIATAGSDDRSISFQITDVTGGEVALGQPASLSHTLRMTETEVVTPGTATIASIRTMTGAISQPLFIEGVIISSNDNVTAKSVYIQDATAAIVLRLTEDNLNTFKRGDKVRVALSGTTISAFNGLLQVNMTKAQGTVVGTTALPAPRQITIAELNAKTYESQLVRIVGVNFPSANGTLTVSGATSFTDGAQSGSMRVEPYSTFVGKILPSGTVTLVGIASVFTTGQLIPQTASDIP
jgi:hypothetical protein